MRHARCACMMCLRLLWHLGGQLVRCGRIHAVRLTWILASPTDRGPSLSEATSAMG